jgi:hypothetical protein
MLELEKPLGPGLPSGMGLGFIVREHRGVRYVGHGTMAAAATDIEFLPGKGIGWYLYPLLALYSASVLAILAAFAVALDAAAAWHDPSRGLVVRVALVPVAVAANCVGGVLIAFDLASFRLDF